MIAVVQRVTQASVTVQSEGHHVRIGRGLCVLLARCLVMLVRQVPISRVPCEFDACSRAQLLLQLAPNRVHDEDGDFSTEWADRTVPGSVAR